MCEVGDVAKTRKLVELGCDLTSVDSVGAISSDQINNIYKPISSLRIADFSGESRRNAPRDSSRAYEAGRLFSFVAFRLVQRCGEILINWPACCMLSKTGVHKLFLL